MWSPSHKPIVNLQDLELVTSMSTPYLCPLVPQGLPHILNIGNQSNEGSMDSILSTIQRGALKKRKEEEGT